MFLLVKFCFLLLIFSHFFSFSKVLLRLVLSLLNKSDYLSTIIIIYSIWSGKYFCCWLFYIGIVLVLDILEQMLYMISFR